MPLSLPSQSPRFDQLQIASSNSIKTADSTGAVNPFVVYQSLYYTSPLINEGDAAAWFTYLTIPRTSTVMAAKIQANVSQLVWFGTSLPTKSRAFYHYCAVSGTSKSNELEIFNDASGYPSPNWFWTTVGSFQFASNGDLQLNLPLATNNQPPYYTVSYIIQGIVKIFST